MGKSRSMSSSVVEERRTISERVDDWGMPLKYSEENIVQERSKDMSRKNTRETVVYEKVESMKKIGMYALAYGK
jgi:hypothetical protein